ncbi:MAG TPA: hypothetical protein VHX18_06825 [Rhizomicrobium sp.]|jgi:hypothetical protein|nr:hypothetical protein [Rhizomicrobium sp.]
MADNIWKNSPDAHDYPAAHDYLSLVLEEPVVRKIVAALGRASTVHYKAKDLLRASQLPLLPRENSHVTADLKKIKKGKALSPVLLVRGDAAIGAPITVADGYHRICASWYRDENIPIACRIVSLRDLPRR